MGITKFLKEKGFIKEDADDNPKQNSNNDASEQKAATTPPLFFPVTSFATESSAAKPDAPAADPSSLHRFQRESSPQQPLDPAFVKFFEDELVKANLPGTRLF